MNHAVSVQIQNKYYPRYFLDKRKRFDLFAFNIVSQY